MKNPIITAILLAGALISYATELTKDINWAEGRPLVHEYFTKCDFETGFNGNVASMLLPVSFRTGQDEQLVFFSAAEHTFVDGTSWELHRSAKGKFERCEYTWSPKVAVWFDSWNLFEIEYHDGAIKYAYHDERYEKVYFEKLDNVGLVSSTWWFLSVTTNAVPHKTVIENGACGLIADQNVKSIRNIVPLRYCGPDANPPAGPTREQARLAESDKATASWRLSGEQMQALAMLHRDHVKQQKPSSIVTNVFIVAGDCNGDGVCDAYVSCDAEKADGENCDWSLYISDDGKFARQTQKIAPLTDPSEIVNADPSVRVLKDSFFRFDRLGMPSYVMPITTEDGVPETWDYAKNGGFVKAFRAENNVPTASFHSCERPNHENIASLQDMFFMIHTSVVYAERLPCIEIPVEN